MVPLVRSVLAITAAAIAGRASAGATPLRSTRSTTSLTRADRALPTIVASVVHDFSTSERRSSSPALRSFSILSLRAYSRSPATWCSSFSAAAVLRLAVAAGAGGVGGMIGSTAVATAPSSVLRHAAPGVAVPFFRPAPARAPPRPMLTGVGGVWGAGGALARRPARRAAMASALTRSHQARAASGSTMSQRPPPPRSSRWAPGMPSRIQLRTVWPVTAAPGTSGRIVAPNCSTPMWRWVDGSGFIEPRGCPCVRTTRRRRGPRTP